MPVVAIHLLDIDGGVDGNTDADLERVPVCGDTLATGEHHYRVIGVSFDVASRTPPLVTAQRGSIA